MGFWCCGFMIGSDNRPRRADNGANNEPLLANKGQDPRTPDRGAPPALTTSPTKKSGSGGGAAAAGGGRGSNNAAPSPKAKNSPGHNNHVWNGAGGELPAAAAGTTNLNVDDRPTTQIKSSKARLTRSNPCVETCRRTYDVSSGRVA